MKIIRKTLIFLIVISLLGLAIYYLKSPIESRLAEINKPKQTYFPDQVDQELWDSIEDSYLQDSTTKNLDPRVAKMKIFLEKKFEIEDFSLYRAGDREDHGKGLAIDLMTYRDKDKGDEIAQYLVKNFDNMGLSYIIWQQKFYMDVRNRYGPADLWNPMEDRGSITANHYDHVHISFKNYENKS